MLIMTLKHTLTNNEVLIHTVNSQLVYTVNSQLSDTAPFIAEVVCFQIRKTCDHKKALGIPEVTKANWLVYISLKCDDSVLRLCHWWIGKDSAVNLNSNTLVEETNLWPQTQKPEHGYAPLSNPVWVAVGKHWPKQSMLYEPLSNFHRNNFCKR